MLTLPVVIHQGSRFLSPYRLGTESIRKASDLLRDNTSTVYGTNHGHVRKIQKTPFDGTTETIGRVLPMTMPPDTPV
jgi:hypothetical protein